jgi:hypothetical protein
MLDAPPTIDTGDPVTVGEGEVVGPLEYEDPQPAVAASMIRPRNTRKLMNASSRTAR